MLAGTFDFGPGVISVVVAICGVVTLWIQQRKANKELKPNGGSSMRDAVDRIEQHSKRTDARFARIEKHIGLEPAPELPPPPPPVA